MRMITGTWHGARATTLVTDQIAVTVLPRRGAKIASMLDVANGREWLEPPTGDFGRAPAYGSNFTDADMSGWDEMMPTIVRCQYPAEPFRGSALPDHGELWSLEWTAESAADALVCSTTGRALPYRFARGMTVKDSMIRFDYELAVEGESALQLLWAAHPQFAVSEAGTRIMLPSEVDQVVDVLSHPMRRERWPNASLESSSRLPECSGRKVYVRPDTRVEWAALVDGNECWLRMAWDSRAVPYLGIWLDNRAYSRRPVIAIEPTTGYYDDLALAISLGRVSTVHPEKPLRWSLEVEVGRGDLREP